MSYLMIIVLKVAQLVSTLLTVYMGYGFPAAIGAQFACPGKLVIDVAGDGSIQMNSQELATSVAYNLGIKIIILNNGFLGMKAGRTKKGPPLKGGPCVCVSFSSAD